jgi:CHASE3 domain sensor protein/GAF domain-containing protein
MMSTDTPDMPVFETPTVADAAPVTPVRGNWLRNLNIGTKLTIGFGLLVGLTLLVFGISAFAARQVSLAQQRVDESSQVVLASSRAHANLLRMTSSVRGYLALGDPAFLESYQDVEQEFRGNLTVLDQLSDRPGFGMENQERLDVLKQQFNDWQTLPGELFVLRDDQMEREPAYNWLNTTGVAEGGQVLIIINEMIEAQARREPSVENNTLLRDMASFQSSFAAMFSGLRGYVTTRNPNFRYYEYEVNLEINDDAWDTLGKQMHLLTDTQQEMMRNIAIHRQNFIRQVPDEAFAVLESDSYEWRRDLSTFEAQVEPLTSDMESLLADMTNNQQKTLQRNLTQAQQTLRTAVTHTMIVGITAVILGTILAFVFRQTIAGPVRRLTGVARQIGGGDLSVQAAVESGDEIGIFARTFNDMTRQLRQTLFQIRKEKKRADDLLHVVIPIGVALSSERDFNRLLANILSEAMAFCRADRGLLFLREERELKLVMLRKSSQDTLIDTQLRNDSLAHIPLYDAETGEVDELHPAPYVACRGQSVNVGDLTDAAPPFSFPRLMHVAQEDHYQAISLLAIPLKNNQDQVLGVLQLLNAQDQETGQVIPFDANLQQMMESFSSLAVAALESYIREQSLRQEIQQLRIEIDENKRQEQVNEIVDSDFFQDLRAKARNLRNRQQPEVNPNSESQSEP